MSISGMRKKTVWEEKQKEKKSKMETEPQKNVKKKSCKKKDGG